MEKPHVKYWHELKDGRKTNPEKHKQGTDYKSTTDQRFSSQFRHRKEIFHVISSLFHKTFSCLLSQCLFLLKLSANERIIIFKDITSESSPKVSSLEEF